MTSFQPAVPAGGYQSISEKLEKATAFKLQGNELFKEGKYKKALIAYAKVLAFTRGLPGSKRGLIGVAGMAAEAGKSKEQTISNEEDALAQELECTVEVNMATCCLKMSRPRVAMDHCARALSMSPRHWKATLRKAEAQAMMDNFDAAFETIESALNMATEQSAITAINNEKRRLMQLRKQQKSTFASGFMMSKESKSSSSTTTEKKKEGPVTCSSSSSSSSGATSAPAANTNTNINTNSTTSSSSSSSVASKARCKADVTTAPADDSHELYRR